MADGRRERGDRTRENILVPGVALATVKGIEGFSYAELAAASGVSKAGIATLFGDKLHLQAAITDRARRVLDERVFAPVLASPRGLPRLETLGTVWVDYLADPELRGGCFFAAAMYELNAQPGPLRDVVRDDMSRWVSGIAAMIEDGQSREELRPDADAVDEALDFFSIGVTANAMIQLGVVEHPEQRARRAWRRHIDHLRIGDSTHG